MVASAPRSPDSSARTRPATYVEQPVEADISYEAASDLPVFGVKGGFLSLMRWLKADPLGFFESAVREHGDIVKVNAVATQLVITRHPEAIRQLLITDANNFTKRTRGYEIMKLLLGEGLVTSEGDFWKRQRRIAQPAFHRKKVADFGEIMTRATSEMVDEWQPRLDSGEPFDVLPEMMQVTLRIVGETLLGTDVSSDANVVGKALGIALEYIAHRTRNPWAMPEWVPNVQNLRFRKARWQLDRIVNQVIAERRGADTEHHDLLGMFMGVVDEETGESMNDRHLRDEIMTMFLAGHETTAMNLAWTIYLLSRHPAVEERLRNELDTVLEGRVPTYGDLAELTYLEQVVKESMRVYPPVPMVARLAEKDCVVLGHKVPKNSYVLFAQYLTHRDEKWWDRPNVFDPDRFHPEATSDRPRLAYFPFSAGRRKCIGDHFAMMESRLVLATMLQRVKLRMVPGHPVQPETSVTMRPRFGLKVVASSA